MLEESPGDKERGYREREREREEGERERERENKREREREKERQTDKHGPSMYDAIAIHNDYLRLIYY